MIKTIIKRMLLLITILVLWQALSTQINPLFIPSPKSVLDSGVIMLKNGQLINGLVFSLKRIAIATCLSGAVSIPLGLLIYNFKFASDTLYPIISLLRYIPVTAFYPLLIMWFGIDETMKIVFLFIAVFVYMLPSVVISLQEINNDLIETGKTIGMNKLQLIYMIQLPATLPSILNSFIVSFGMGFTYIAVIEQINAVYGLGYIIHQGSSRGRTDLVFMGIIVIMFVSVIIDSVSKLLVKRLFRWKYVNNSNDL